MTFAWTLLSAKFGVRHHYQIRLHELWLCVIVRLLMRIFTWLAFAATDFFSACICSSSVINTPLLIFDFSRLCRSHNILLTQQPHKHTCRTVWDTQMAGRAQNTAGPKQSFSPNPPHSRARHLARHLPHNRQFPHLRWSLHAAPDTPPARGGVCGMGWCKLAKGGGGGMSVTWAVCDASVWLWGDRDWLPLLGPAHAHTDFVRGRRT